MRELDRVCSAGEAERHIIDMGAADTPAAKGRVSSHQKCVAYFIGQKSLVHSFTVPVGDLGCSINIAFYNPMFRDVWRAGLSRANNEHGKTKMKRS
jgi:hypothetical protein